MGFSSLVITEGTTREEVLEAYAAGRDLENFEGYQVRDFVCPHCDLWIGVPEDYPDPHVVRVSVQHGVTACGLDDDALEHAAVGRIY